ncbi:ankyrin repeat-containing domain protein [Nemania sp. FL0031]|nr:ankyrin repeat-containing domain protein [Nemania sp. FL0031]
MRRKIRSFLRRDNQNRGSGGTAVPVGSVERPPAGNAEGRPTVAPSNSAPLDAAKSATPSVPTPASTPAPDPPRTVQTQSEQHAGQAPDRPKPPQPYASNSGLWNEALGALPKPEMRKLIEEHIGVQSHNVKDLAGDIQSKIDAAFKSQQHDSRTSHVLENAISVLKMFASAVDVAVSYDPAHAALPWALVRSVIVFLASGSELKDHLLTAMAMVVSLLVQCDTYQQLYMAPDFVLRPREAQLGKLKESIVLAYVKSQTLLVIAIQQGQRKTRLIAAPFKLGGIQSCIDELAKCEKQLVQVAEDCEKLCNASLRSNVQELQTLKDSFHEIAREHINLVLETIGEEEQRKVLEWISPILYGKHHARVKEARTSDTCEWLLAHEKFREWEGASSSVILWLQGSPGAGKTFLASKVIDYIRARPKSSREGLAFFYCDRNEEQRRKALSILRSYVRQLATTLGNPEFIRKRLQDLYREKWLYGSDLSTTDCIEQLVDLVSLYDQTTLVLDALDECELDSRREIIEAIELLFKSGNSVKVFISSRPDRDIRNRFIHRPNIEIQATDNEKDIQKFINEEISKHENWAHMAPDLRKNIISTVFTKSQGMFQWVFLQIKEILLLETEAAILDRLGKLPADLETAYDEIYGKIKARHKDDRALADNALKWVAAACQPLESYELLSIIRIDLKEDTFHLYEAISESQLLHLCNNLLVLDSMREVWRFSHLSVTEYFENNHWSLVMTHRHCASVCLKALLTVQPGWNTSNWSDDSEDEEGSVYEVTRSSENRDIQMRQLNGHLRANRRLQGYARKYWMTHIENQEIWEADPRLSSLLKSFLGTPGRSSLQYRKWFADAQIDEVGDFDDLRPVSIALFAIYRFSFRNILHDWWEDPKLDLSLRNKNGLNALAIAAKYGHKQNCENLIRLGIDVNLTLRTHRGSALAEAVADGQADMVKFLVKKAQANVNLHLPGGYGSALVAAAASSDEGPEIVQFLVQAGADINQQLQAGDYGSALAAATTPRGSKRLESVQYLIKAGADINQQLQAGEYGSALAAAAATGMTVNQKIVKHLIKAGADINQQLQAGEYGSALTAAAARGRSWRHIVQYLVKAGADINQQLQVGQYGSALAAAACTADDNLETVQFLVQAGADINMQLRAGKYGSALAAAAAFGNRETAQLLIQARADINLQLRTGKFGSALAAAVAMAQVTVLEYFVQLPTVDVNQQILHGGYGGSALAVAAYWGREDYADILIKAGADVNLKIENGPFRTALQASQVNVPKICYGKVGTLKKIWMRLKRAKLSWQNCCDDMAHRRKSSLEHQIIVIS